jgi:hypothetical protein
MLGMMNVVPFLFLCSCISLIDIVKSEQAALDKDEFVLVIDAGSSGSRVHVYKYRWGSQKIFPEVELPDKKFKITPGLSSFAENPKVFSCTDQPCQAITHQDLGISF